jgi:ABC-type multidrug transport system permease subunit
MLRSIELVFFNEFRLLLRDRASLFMIFVAPVVIIAVAGFSLGNLFGTPSVGRGSLIAVVDYDHGMVARAIIDALTHEPQLEVVEVADLNAARRIVLSSVRASLAVLIPSNTTTTFESGQTASIEIMIDPVKRLQASALELRLNELSQNLASAAQARLRDQFVHTMVELRARLEQADTQSKSFESALRDYRRQLGRTRKAAQQAFRVKLQRQLETVKAEFQASIAEAIAVTKQRLDQAMAERRRSLIAIEAYLRSLSRSETEFDTWFARLKALAGSNAGRIPPPPQLPPPPAQQQLAQLTQPLDFSISRPQLPDINVAELKLPIPDLPPFPRLTLDRPKASTPVINVPGAIVWKEGSITSSKAEANAFEQYVPGFGVTFLLIDMLWGVSVALMDERQWGTLQRLRVSGASTAGMLIGRMSARTLIGFVQMIVLFGVGWLLFGITLGRSPAMLLLPSGAIAFAGAAFGLVLATIAPSRDSVLPIGAVAAMVMSAVGGCWWPLEFEPDWMRAAALSVPTTWTMRAFNDLMIRGLGPATALWPTAMATGLGLLFLLGGIAGSPRLYRWLV